MPANITLNQAGKAAGAPGLARIDFITGVPVVATNATVEASYAWTLLHVPYGSMLSVGGIVTTPTFTFVPDVIGAYRVGLSVNNTPLLEDTTALIAAVLGAQNLTQGQTDAVINKVIQSIAVNAPVGQERLVSTHPETGRLDMSLLPAGVSSGGGGGGTPSDTAPAALGATAAAGTATEYSRGDHVHPRPTAVQIGAAPLSPPVIEITDADSPFTLLPIHAGQIIRVDASEGAVDIVAPDSLWSGSAFVCWFDVIDATNGVSITGEAAIAFTDTIPIGISQFLVTSATTASLVRDSWTIANDALVHALASLRPEHERVLSSATYTIQRSDEGQVLFFTGAVNPVNITINQAALVPIGTRGFRVYGRVGSLTNPVSLTFAQPANVVWLGDKRVLNKVGDFFELIIATGLAIIRIYTNDAPARLDPLAPLVQATHTAATRTIAVGDAGDIIPFSAASNAIAVTIPHTLFGSLEAGRAFVFEGRVVNIANPITLAGSGGLVLSYYGPKSALSAVGDSFVVVVRSATSADVYIAERRP